MKLFAFIIKDLRILMSYKFRLILRLGTYAVSLLFLFYISKTFEGTGNAYLAQYGGNYFPYVLIGIAVSGFVNVGLHTFSNEIRNAQIEGTLEALLNTPTSVYTVLVGNSLWSFIESFIGSCVLLGIGIVYFKLHFSVFILSISLLVLLLVFLAFLAIGMVSAAFIMLFKQGNPIILIFGYSSFLLGGVLFPVEVLPEFLQYVSIIFPLTPAINILRDILLTDKGMIDAMPAFLNLIIFIVLVLPCSFAAFGFSIKRAKMNGSLVQY